MIDLFDDKVVSVDYNRDQGFLDGMGIDLADETANGDEEATGTYSGGEYEIVGNEASQGAEDGGRTAAETLLSKNPDINVVYTINEPAAYGRTGVRGASATDELIVVSVDGGCAGVDDVKEGHHRRDEPAVPGQDGRTRGRGDRRAGETGRPPRPPKGSTSSTPESPSSRTARGRRGVHRHHRSVRDLLGLRKRHRWRFE